jgi:hypothetical protein
MGRATSHGGQARASLDIRPPSSRLRPALDGRSDRNGPLPARSTTSARSTGSMRSRCTIASASGGATCGRASASSTRPSSAWKGRPRADADRRLVVALPWPTRRRRRRPTLPLRASYRPGSGTGTRIDPGGAEWPPGQKGTPEPDDHRAPGPERREEPGPLLCAARMARP